jgi:hypothetical protein
MKRHFKKQSAGNNKAFENILLKEMLHRAFHFQPHRTWRDKNCAE